MAVKQWNVGDVLTAADMNAWTVPLAAVATADQSRTSAPGLADDAALTVTLAANASYDMHLHAKFTGPASNGAPFNFTGPAGCTATFAIPANGTSAGGANDVGLNAGIVATFGLATSGTGTPVAYDVFGTVVTGASGGAFTFQWAQTTSSATTTTRKAMSALVLRRIS